VIGPDAKLAAARALGMRAAVRAHLQARLAGYRCEEHGEATRLVGEGEELEIEGCCPAAIEQATRGVVGHG